MQPLAQLESRTISNDLFREYSPCSEAVPMTFQVALVATDGIVLGSDRQMNFTPPDWGAVTSSSQVSKIFRNESRGIMACWSGFDPAIRVAKEAIQLPDNKIQSPTELENLATAVYEHESSKLGVNYGDSEVLLVTKNDLAKIFRINVKKESSCYPALDKAIAGHTANVSVYFIERFYKKLPMAQLILLVAHSILEAGRIHPYGIQGLEIACCSKDGLKPVPDDKISELIGLSNCVESEIRRLLFP